MSAFAQPATGALPVRREVEIPTDTPPQLFVVVDTEEEFDWNAPFSRQQTSVSAMRYIERTQRILDRYGIAPIYVIDFPVAAQREGFEPLQQPLADGRCVVGAHMHPWVTPPHEEEVNAVNSFTCNLPPALQRAKVEVLGETIEANLGVRPRIFKAGRYGLGRETVEILDALEYEVDTSVSPRMDFSDTSGPDFSPYTVQPFFLTDRLMELPCTIEYVGWLGASGGAVHRVASRPAGERMRLPGVLSRLGATNRIMLSPEGNTLEEMQTLARHLMRRGCRVFTLSFHSPSVLPGCTPYVRSDHDLTTFLRTIDRFCEFFMKELAGRPACARSFRGNVLASGLPS